MKIDIQDLKIHKKCQNHFKDCTTRLIFRGKQLAVTPCENLSIE